MCKVLQQRTYRLRMVAQCERTCVHPQINSVERRPKPIPLKLDIVHFQIVQCYLSDTVMKCIRFCICFQNSLDVASPETQLFISQLSAYAASSVRASGYGKWRSASLKLRMNGNVRISHSISLIWDPIFIDDHSLWGPMNRFCWIQMIPNIDRFALHHNSPTFLSTLLVNATTNPPK